MNIYEDEKSISTIQMYCNKIINCIKNGEFETEDLDVLKNLCTDIIDMVDKLKNGGSDGTDKIT